MRAKMLALAFSLALSASAASAGTILVEEGTAEGDGYPNIITLTNPFGPFARYRFTVVADHDAGSALSSRFLRIDVIEWADGPPYAPPGGGFYYHYAFDLQLDCAAGPATPVACYGGPDWDPRRLTDISFAGHVVQFTHEQPTPLPAVEPPPGDGYNAYGGEDYVELTVGWEGPGPVHYRIYAAEIPEPATWTLMMAGFGLAGAGLRRRRAAVAV